MKLGLESSIICYYIVTICLVWIPDGSSQCSCYSFDGTNLMSWSGARKLCTDNNGDLVSMETVEEWKFIKTQIQNRTAQYENEWWIGLEKRGEKWEWLSNHTLTYNKWQYDKPDDDERCIHVIIARNYPLGTYGLFRNKRDFLTRGAICEYKGQEACSIGLVSWCITTTPMTTTITHHVTKRPLVRTSNQMTQLTTSRLQVHKEKAAAITTDHHKIQTNTDCTPYPLLVTAIFVSVLGGLTVLATGAFFLVPFVMKKSP